MAYANNNSMLALIVLRSNVDRKRWGNILVHPNVTNIVWWTYAEWSIMSYDGTKLYDANNTQEWEIARQLYWYGSIFSSNSVGWAFKPPYECPYDSDFYQNTKNKSCWQTEASKYDLAFLRRFVLIDWGSGVCTNATKQAAKWTGTGTISYAFAGKKQCYGSDPINNWLKSSNKTTPVVIEYNPAIQNIGMKIFSAQ
jgi:hypothetical protein